MDIQIKKFYDVMPHERSAKPIWLTEEKKEPAAVPLPTPEASVDVEEKTALHKWYFDKHTKGWDKILLRDHSYDVEEDFKKFWQGYCYAKGKTPDFGGIE